MSDRAQRIATTALALALAGVGLMACGTDDEGSPSTESVPPVELAGTQWALDTAALDVPGAGDVSSSIRFERERVAGDDGCNQFTGGYEVDGSTLTFGPLAGTRKACAGAAGEVGERVTSALNEVQSYAVSGETLRLLGSGGDPLLTYRASAPGVEGEWEAVSVLYDDAIRSVIIGTTLTATFTVEETVSGSGGCNTFTGGYQLHGQAIRIGPLASTQKACVEPEGAAEQEAGYFAALESARRIDQTGDSLTLLNGKGQMAVTFNRAG